MRRTIAAALLASACTGEPLRVHSTTDLTAEQYDALVSAQEYLGREIVLAESRRAAVTIVWWDHCRLVDGVPTCGLAGDRQLGCRRLIESTPQAWVVAHEIAHAFWIGHSDDENDLMWPMAKEGASIGEIDALDRRIERFADCKLGRD